jgi:hypothetical protein
MMRANVGSFEGANCAVCLPASDAYGLCFTGGFGFGNRSTSTVL